MRELKYENQGTNTYLVYEVTDQDIVDSISLGMLTNNKILGLAQTIFIQSDNRKFVKFNVSAKVSVSQFFSGAVNKKRLLGVFRGIVNAMLSAEDYMLDLSSIILDLDYIFTDVSTCETVLICIPVSNDKTKMADMKEFFRKIIFNIQFDSEENGDYVTKIINYLNSTAVFSLDTFNSLLGEIQSVAVQPVVAKTRVNSQSVVAPVNQTREQLHTLPVVSQATPEKVAQQTIPSAKFNTKGMTIPPKKDHNTSVEPQEKEISFFYLMQHYNKENAAAYKAQKQAKKQAASEVKEKKSAEKASKKKKGKQSTQAVPDLGFAVPGQPPQAKMPPPETQPPQPAAQQAASPQVPYSTAQPSYQGVTTPPVQPGPASQSPYPMPHPPYPAAQPPYQGAQMNFGETTVLGGGGIGETTVLNEGQNPAQTAAPHLIRVKNNERIPLNKAVFRIGKERSFVDYFIGDNTAVSRSHANFIARDGEYFVVDTNSTNHTFVNGQMIQSNSEVKISPGDTIRLGNEDFEFKIY